MKEKIVAFLRKYDVAIVAAILIFLLLFGGLIYWFVQKRPSLTVFKTSLGCIICHRRDSAMFVHAPYGRADCLSCHYEHREKGKEMIREPLALTCFACHKKAQKALQASYRHPPFEKGNCLSCHKPHVSNYSLLLASSETTICVVCHRGKNEIGKPVTHPPYAKKQCMSCHSGHGSSFKAHVLGKGQDLCFGCHPKVAKKWIYRVKHNPFDTGDCMNCHRPHAAMHKSLLDTKSPKLCFNCHPNVNLVMGQVSHHPVPEGKIKCEDCHDPHASKFDFLTLKPAMITSPGCLVCHVPHGSDNPPLLKFSSTTLCLTCHNPKLYSGDISSGSEYSHNAHPLGVWDVHANKPLTCISTCHRKLVFSAFTQDRNGALARVIREDLCTSCHKGHETGVNTKGIHGNSNFHVQYDPPVPLTDGLCLFCHETKELP